MATLCDIHSDSDWLCQPGSNNHGQEADSKDDEVEFP